MAVQEFEHKLARDRAELLKIAVPSTTDQLQFGSGNSARQQPSIRAGVDLILAAVDDQGGDGDAGQQWPAVMAFAGLVMQPAREGRPR